MPSFYHIIKRKYIAKGTHACCTVCLHPSLQRIVHHQSPWSCIAAAVLLKPAMFAPATSDGNSPSAPGTYSLAVSRQFSKHAFMMPLSFSSTSSLLHFRRWLFCAISRPETATPPALAALPG